MTTEVHEATLKIEPSCEHCGCKGSSQRSPLKGLLVEMKSYRQDDVDGKPPPNVVNVPWYLCIRCWVEGASPAATPTAVVEHDSRSAPAAETRTSDEKKTRRTKEKA